MGTCDWCWFPTTPLGRIARIQVSNVDKIIAEDEQSVRLCNYVDVYYNDRITEQMSLSLGSASQQEISKFTLLPNDVLITKDSESPDDIAVPALVDRSAAGIVCGYHLAILRPNKSLVRGEFLFWSLKSRPVNDAFSLNAKGVTRFGLTLNGMASVPIPIPSLETQQAIADFLDRETTRIDQLIAKKKRMIAVVEEQRSATISLAVTQGLDRNMSLMETSSPYLPLIPESWSIQRLKQLAVVRGGITLGRELPPGLPTFETPYLRVANVQAGRLDLGVVTSLQATESEINRYSLRANDVLMNEGGDNDKLGRGAVWDGSINPCLHQNHVFAVRPHDPEIAHWIAFASNSRYGRDFFYLNSKQSTNLASISKSRLEQFPIALPQSFERFRILDMLAALLRRSDSLIESINMTINRLRELRSALITAAVTGQIDVTTWRRRGHSERHLEAIALAEAVAHLGSASDA